MQYTCTVNKYVNDTNNNDSDNDRMFVERPEQDARNVRDDREERMEQFLHKWKLRLISSVGLCLEK